MAYNKTTSNPMLLANLEAFAQYENAQGQRYYMDDPKPCAITELVTCEFLAGVSGWLSRLLGFDCKFGFSYPVTVQGTQNFCTYTGNKHHYCDKFSCKKNG